MLGAPTGARRLSGESVARHRGDDDVESILRLTTMCGRVGEPSDELDLLKHGAGPAVADEQRKSFGTLRTDVDEMNVETVDLGQELWEWLQRRLETPEVNLPSACCAWPMTWMLCRNAKPADAASTSDDSTGAQLFDFAASHSCLVSSRNPCPLQAFCPLQALCADLQADCPLQAFTPLQWTFASSAEAMEIAPRSNSKAAAAAIAALEITLVVDMMCSFASCETYSRTNVFLMSQRKRRLRKSSVIRQAVSAATGS